mmetsp:Transcript_14796/g.19139  ORF Transcript_14796/g.19139 Transcript_14796/m.19139 type:complete len:410 (+) Transcript_14796:1148-2377(+)
MDTEPEGIEYVVHLKFHADVLKAYIDTVILPISSIVQDMVGDTNRNVNVLDKYSIEPRYAVDKETWNQAFFLNRKLLLMVASDGPLPPCHDLLPAAVNSWNKWKGGVDVISRLLVNFGDYHQRLYLFAKFPLRGFRTLNVNAHLCSRLMQFEPDLHKPKSMSEMKDCLNKLGSIRQFSKKAFHLVDELFEDDSIINASIINYNGTALKLTRGSSARNQSPLWSFGEGKNIRETASKLVGVHRHKMSKITAPNQQTHANKNKRFRLRCIVCCQICDKQMKENGEITKHNRLGYQTQWQCNQCGKDANSFISRRKGTQSQRDLSPALCAEKFKRFERIFSDEHRSCMQIHHSASPFPGLICRPQPEEGTSVPSFGLISPPKQLTSQGDEEMLTVAHKRRKRKRHDQGAVQA